MMKYVAIAPASDPCYVHAKVVKAEEEGMQDWSIS